jgi:hypothetical protein
MTPPMYFERSQFYPSFLGWLSRQENLRGRIDWKLPRLNASKAPEQLWTLRTLDDLALGL